MFALEGSLGLEFQRLEAPYVVEQVHGTGVAYGLGIEKGDELVAVADHDVTGEFWSNLVERLSQRPVVARFRRDTAKGQTVVEQKAGQDGFISSVGSLLRAVPGRASAANGGSGAKTSAGAGNTEAQERMQAEMERLNTLLRARDEEVQALLGRLAQREEALRVFEAAGASADGGGAGSNVAEAARFAEERMALTQQVSQLQARAEAAEVSAETLRAERDHAVQQCAVEAKEKEEHRGQATALAERCGSLMTQFESLRTTCENLSLDAQQKAGLESQVQELMKVNVQWQQAHQSLNDEKEGLQHHVGELQQLRAEVAQLRRVEAACSVLEERLREADARLDEQANENARLQGEGLSAQATIQRLQSLLEAMEDTGASHAGQLESELLERSRECAALRREAEELRRLAAEHVRRQQEMQEAAEDGRTLRSELSSVREALAKAEEEKKALGGVVDRCVEKLEKDSRERPHLVDKRMVTQMIAAFLEHRDKPRQAQDIMAKMADLLGFTSAEREQVGLSQQRRSLLRQTEDPTNLSELSDRFMDFLLEEAET
eukprot:TRINITY_DN25433_c1_g4_i1.p1 TRINITY_DN25433_c1_g4~~TRINITY_DN25433_c1_g4_i1.p1  ORF type:complete len:549 (-),score=177.86 TRINITY_DN25433_c1_g4_i1:36-1682(-)